MPTRQLSIATRPTLALAIVLTTAAHAGGVRYVDDDAAPGGDGTTWETAYRFLQSALIEAAGVGGIGEIRVAQGLYRPDEGPDVKTGDRKVSFALVDDVTLRGAYLGLSAGKGEDPDERDVAAYPTVLSGDLAADDEPGFVNTAENSYHVVIAVDLGDAVVMDGLIVRGGRADGPGFGPSPESKDQGSGVNVYFSSPTFVDCSFEDNWARNHGTLNDHGNATILRCTFRGNYAQTLGAGLYMHFHAQTVVTECRFIDNATPGRGGGVYNRGSTSAVLTDCEFIGNTAGLGGGLYSNELSGATVRGCLFRNNTAATGGAMFNLHATPLIDDCTFEGNVGITGDGGGAIWNQGGCPVISGCAFTANVGRRGGGIYNGDESRSIITGTTFTDNTSLDDGGGLSNDSSVTEVSDCVFIGNECGGGTFVTGGGMSNYFSTTTVTRCTFFGNTAFVGAFTGGGGLYFEGVFDDDSRVTSCTFIDNHAEAGGALYNFRGSPIVTGCLFARNTASTGLFPVGGAIYNNFVSHPQLINCTFSGNEAEEAGGAMFDFASAPVVTNSIFWGDLPDEIDGDESSGAVVRYSTIEGGWTGEGAENQAADPQFADPGNDDYRLAAGSPCIDAGDNWALPRDVDDLDDDGDTAELLPADLDGAFRIADHEATPGTGCGAGPMIVDLGAYEAPGPALDPAFVADLDGSGLVDFGDILAVLTDWGTCADPECCPADLDGSGLVDFGDILAILTDWS